MPIRLVPLDDVDLPTIIIDRPIIVIGRHSECDVQIRSSKVSRKHCCLAEGTCSDSQPLTLSVRDLDSTNGTRINGKVVVEGRLTEGDELAVGAFRFLVTSQAVQGVPVQDKNLFSSEDPIPLLEPPHDHVLDQKSNELPHPEPHLSEHEEKSISWPTT